MAAFWAEMGMTYLEINKLPCLHEFDIPKGINVYSICRTKLNWHDRFLCFVIFNVFRCMKLYCTFFYFTCTRGDTEKNQKNFSIETTSANPRIVLCSVVYRRCIAQTLV